MRSPWGVISHELHRQEGRAPSLGFHLRSREACLRSGRAEFVLHGFYFAKQESLVIQTDKFLMVRVPLIGHLLLCAVAVTVLAPGGAAAADAMQEQARSSRLALQQGYPPFDSLMLETMEVVDALDIHRFDFSVGLIAGFPRLLSDREGEAGQREFVLSPSLTLQLPVSLFDPNYYAPAVPLAKLRATRETRIPALRAGLENDRRANLNRREEVSNEIDRLGKAIDAVVKEAEAARSEARAGDRPAGENAGVAQLELQMERLKSLRERAKTEATALQDAARALDSVPQRIDALVAFVMHWERVLSSTLKSKLLSFSFEVGMLMSDIIAGRARFMLGYSYQLAPERTGGLGFSVGLLIPAEVAGRIVPYAGVSFNTNILHVFHGGYRNSGFNIDVLVPAGGSYFEKP